MMPRRRHLLDQMIRWIPCMEKLLSRIEVAVVDWRRRYAGRDHLSNHQFSLFLCRWELEETRWRSGCGSRVSRGTTRSHPASGPNPHKLSPRGPLKNGPSYVVTNPDPQQILMGRSRGQAPKLPSLGHTVLNFCVLISIFRSHVIKLGRRHKIANYTFGSRVRCDFKSERKSEKVKKPSNIYQLFLNPTKNKTIDCINRVKNLAAID